MGGKGARERRERERQALNEGGATNGASSVDLQRKKSDHRRQRTPNKTKFQQNRQMPQRAHKTATIKKKPKHLKRKLVQASTDQDKQRFRDQLADYEMKKKNYLESDKFKTKQEQRELDRKNKKLGSRAKSRGDGASNEPAETTNQMTSAVETKAVAAKEPKLADDAESKEERAEKQSTATTEPKKQRGNVDEQEATVRRQRGKRRRGRQDTSKVVAKQQQEEKEAMKEDEAKESTPTAPKKKKKRTDRYCLGRKPLTDFEVGKSYPATVVYVKPSLGIFVDIGCHQDAFCHISRLADDFVDDIAYQAGDTIDECRVVEIDRANKKITLSLQSEARLADELASMKAHQERLAMRHEKQSKLSMPKKRQPNGSKKKPATSSTKTDKLTAEEFLSKSDHELTLAGQKRARKLARRAARREQQRERESS